MKVIGLIGGMSWQSTATYYSSLNHLARERLGGLHSAKLLLWSFDFSEIEAMQAAGNWQAATDAMIEAAQNLERGGAECILICTNTMHMMAPEVQGAVGIPLLHIADATATAIKAANCSHPLLLATNYTMEKEFYKGRLLDKHGIEAMIPNAEDRTIVHDIIYHELCLGELKQSSKAKYIAIVEKAIDAGCDSVIFGCTEVGLLISADDFNVPAFDTTLLHAEAALDFALES